MHRFSRISATRLFLAGVCAGLAALPSLAQVSSVRSVKVLGTKEVVEIEVEASDRIVPQTRVLTGPDRLVIDFPNTRPTSDARNQSVDRGEVKDVRVGLFQSKPPITRLVLDLKTAQSFQVFPYGRTVMIKVTGSSAVASAPSNVSPAVQPASASGLVAANYTPNPAPQPPLSVPQPPLQISYLHGMLSIHSDKATLSEVLFEIQKRTGADIAIPAGAEQEKVVAEIQPAPAPEVLAHLLNGSKFNFLILSAPDDPNKLDRVILSTRTEGNFVAPLQPMANNDANDGSDDDEPAIVRNNEQQQQPPNGPQEAPTHEPPNNGQINPNTPDQ